MTEQEENEFYEYMCSLSQQLEEKVLQEFALSLKDYLTAEQEQLLFEVMYRNDAFKDCNCEHDILKDLGVHAWKWDEFLSNRK